jgi:hypothetical protein
MCHKKYDIGSISLYAIRRYVEGQNTIDMLIDAKTSQEVEEICLVCSLDIEDNQIEALELKCGYNKDCNLAVCRRQIRNVIAHEKLIQQNERNIKKIL